MTRSMQLVDIFQISNGPIKRSLCLFLRSNPLEECVYFQCVITHRVFTVSFAELHDRMDTIFGPVYWSIQQGLLPSSSSEYLSQSHMISHTIQESQRLPLLSSTVIHTILRHLSLTTREDDFASSSSSLHPQFGQSEIIVFPVFKDASAASTTADHPSKTQNDPCTPSQLSRRTESYDADRIDSFPRSVSSGSIRDTRTMSSRRISSSSSQLHLIPTTSERGGDVFYSNGSGEPCLSLSVKSGRPGNDEEGETVLVYSCSNHSSSSARQSAHITSLPNHIGENSAVDHDQSDLQLSKNKSPLDSPFTPLVLQQTRSHDPSTHSLLHSPNTAAHSSTRKLTSLGTDRPSSLLLTSKDANLLHHAYRPNTFRVDASTRNSLTGSQQMNHSHGMLTPRSTLCPTNGYPSSSCDNNYSSGVSDSDTSEEEDEMTPSSRAVRVDGIITRHYCSHLIDLATLVNTKVNYFGGLYVVQLFLPASTFAFSPLGREVLIGGRLPTRLEALADRQKNIHTIVSIGPSTPQKQLQPSSYEKRTSLVAQSAYGAGHDISRLSLNQPGPLVQSDSSNSLPYLDNSSGYGYDHDGDTSESSLNLSRSATPKYVPAVSTAHVSASPLPQHSSAFFNNRSLQYRENAGRMQHLRNSATESGTGSDYDSDIRASSFNFHGKSSLLPLTSSNPAHHSMSGGFEAYPHESIGTPSGGVSGGGALRVMQPSQKQLQTEQQQQQSFNNYQMQNQVISTSLEYGLSTPKPSLSYRAPSVSSLSTNNYDTSDGKAIHFIFRDGKYMDVRKKSKRNRHIREASVEAHERYFLSPIDATTFNCIIQGMENDYYENCYSFQGETPHYPETNEFTSRFNHLINIDGGSSASSSVAGNQISSGRESSQTIMLHTSFHQYYPHDRLSTRSDMMHNNPTLNLNLPPHDQDPQQKQRSLLDPTPSDATTPSEPVNSMLTAIHPGQSFPPFTGVPVSHGTADMASAASHTVLPSSNQNTTPKKTISDATPHEKSHAHPQTPSAGPQGPQDHVPGAVAPSGSSPLLIGNKLNVHPPAEDLHSGQGVEPSPQSLTSFHTAQPLPSTAPLAPKCIYTGHTFHPFIPYLTSSCVDFSGLIDRIAAIESDSEDQTEYTGSPTGDDSCSISPGLAKAQLQPQILSQSSSSSSFLVDSSEAAISPSTFFRGLALTASQEGGSPHQPADRRLQIYPDDQVNDAAYRTPRSILRTSAFYTPRHLRVRPDDDDLDRDITLLDSSRALEQEDRRNKRNVDAPRRSRRAGRRRDRDDKSQKRSSSRRRHRDSGADRLTPRQNMSRLPSGQCQDSTANGLLLPSGPSISTHVADPVKIPTRNTEARMTRRASEQLQDLMLSHKNPNTELSSYSRHIESDVIEDIESPTHGGTAHQHVEPQELVVVYDEEDDRSIGDDEEDDDSSEGKSQEPCELSSYDARSETPKTYTTDTQSLTSSFYDTQSHTLTTTTTTSSDIDEHNYNPNLQLNVNNTRLVNQPLYGVNTDRSLPLASLTLISNHETHQHCKEPFSPIMSTATHEYVYVPRSADDPAVLPKRSAHPVEHGENSNEQPKKKHVSLFLVPTYIPAQVDVALGLVAADRMTSSFALGGVGPVPGAPRESNIVPLNVYPPGNTDYSKYYKRPQDYRVVSSGHQIRQERYRGIADLRLSSSPLRRKQQIRSFLHRHNSKRPEVVIVLDTDDEDETVSISSLFPNRCFDGDTDSDSDGEPSSHEQRCNVVHLYEENRRFFRQNHSQCHAYTRLSPNMPPELASVFTTVAALSPLSQYALPISVQSHDYRLVNLQTLCKWFQALPSSDPSYQILMKYFIDDIGPIIPFPFHYHYLHPHHHHPLFSQIFRFGHNFKSFSNSSYVNSDYIWMVKKRQGFFRQLRKGTSGLTRLLGLKADKSKLKIENDSTHITKLTFNKRIQLYSVNDNPLYSYNPSKKPTKSCLNAATYVTPIHLNLSEIHKTSFITQTVSSQGSGMSSVCYFRLMESMHFSISPRNRLPIRSHTRNAQSIDEILDNIGDYKRYIPEFEAPHVSIRNLDQDRPLRGNGKRSGSLSNSSMKKSNEGTHGPSRG